MISDFFRVTNKGPFCTAEVFIEDNYITQNTFMPEIVASIGEAPHHLDMHVFLVRQSDRHQRNCPQDNERPRIEEVDTHHQQAVLTPPKGPFLMTTATRFRLVREHEVTICA